MPDVMHLPVVCSESSSPESNRPSQKPRLAPFGIVRQQVLGLFDFGSSYWRGAERPIVRRDYHRDGQDVCPLGSSDVDQIVRDCVVGVSAWHERRIAASDPDHGQNEKDDEDYEKALVDEYQDYMAQRRLLQYFFPGRTFPGWNGYSKKSPYCSEDRYSHSVLLDGPGDCKGVLQMTVGSCSSFFEVELLEDITDMEWVREQLECLERLVEDDIEFQKDRLEKAIESLRAQPQTQAVVEENFEVKAQLQPFIDQSPEEELDEEAFKEGLFAFFKNINSEEKKQLDRLEHELAMQDYRIARAEALKWFLQERGVLDRIDEFGRDWLVSFPFEDEKWIFYNPKIITDDVEAMYEFGLLEENLPSLNGGYGLGCFTDNDLGWDFYNRGLPAARNMRVSIDYGE